MPTKLQERQRQHVEQHRKELLRKRLLYWARPGTAYVPYIGDGDLAVDLYADRTVLGADNDPERVATARRRVNGEVRLADCEAEWPFADCEDPIAVADFDAYAEPFTALRAFWPQAPKLDRLVAFFTDGMMRGTTYSGHWIRPDGEREFVDPPDRAAIFHFYLTRHVWPWFDEYVSPYRVLHRMQYRRGLVFYWGAVLQRETQ